MLRVLAVTIILLASKAQAAALPDQSLRPWDTALALGPAAISAETPDDGFTDHGEGIDFFFAEPRTPRQKLRNLFQAVDNGALARVAEALPGLAQDLPDDPDIRRISAMVVAIAGRRDLARSLLSELPLSNIENDFETLARAAIARSEGRLTSADALARVAMANSEENALAANLVGTIAWQSGKISEAVNAFRKAGETGAGFAAPWRNLLAIAEAKGDWSMALTAANKLLTALPENTETENRCPALLAKARALSYQQQPLAAIDTVRACLAGGWQHRAGSMLASLLVQTEQVDNAPRALSAVARNTPNYAALLAAELALKQDDLITAAAALGPLAQDQAGAALLAAINAAGRRNWTESREHLDRSIALEGPNRMTDLFDIALAAAASQSRPETTEASPDPLNAFVYGAAFQAAGDPDAARPHWQDAGGFLGDFRLSAPDTARLGSERDTGGYHRLGLAALLHEAGFTALALRVMGEHDAETDAAISQWLRAKLLLAQDQDETALSLLNQAVAHDRAISATYSTKARALLGRGEVDEALSLLRSLAQDRGSAETLLDFAAHEIDAGRDEAAIALYQSAAALFPDDPAAHLAAVYHYTERLPDRPESIENAAAHAREALSMDRSNPAAVAAAGWVDFRLGDKARAARQLRRALALMDQPDPAVLVRLAMVEQAIGNRMIALDHVQEALAIAEEQNRSFELYTDAVALQDALRSAR